MSYQIGGYAFMTDPGILPGYIGALQASINALSASGTPQEQISQLCQEFMNNAQPAESCAATSIEDETMATLYTEVDFKLDDPDYLYKLDEQISDDHEKTGQTQLSEWAEIATQKMLRSPCLLHHNSEHKSRFVIDAILLDRLDQLDDAVSERLTWFYDVPLAVWSDLKGEWIQGKAANCLMYGKQINDMHTALLVLEAKELGKTTDITQLITYLAAVQNARKKNGKLDVSVFGISTDAYGWQFLFLNSDRKLFASPAINWYFQSSLVIQWVDRILQDAIRITS